VGCVWAELLHCQTRLVAAHLGAGPCRRGLDNGGGAEVENGFVRGQELNGEMRVHEAPILILKTPLH
jgi:hypothetical protein